MTIILIILLIIIIIYLYYQNRKLQGNSRPSDGDSSSLIFETENEDLIAEKDLAIRQKNETEAENLALNNRLKNKQQEVSRKEQEIERLKNEKNRVEVNLNKKISEKNGLITTLKQQHTEQLRRINCLFDEKAENYESIDFNGLYSLLEKIAQKNLPGSFPEEKDD